MTRPRPSFDLLMRHLLDFDEQSDGRGMTVTAAIKRGDSWKTLTLDVGGRLSRYEQCRIVSCWNLKDPPSDMCHEPEDTP